MNAIPIRLAATATRSLLNRRIKSPPNSFTASVTAACDIGRGEERHQSRVVAQCPTPVALAHVGVDVDFRGHGESGFPIIGFKPSRKFGYCRVTPRTDFIFRFAMRRFA